MSSNNAMPPAKIWSGSCSGASNPGGQVLNTTVFTMILGYIEQTALYNAYNFSQASSNSAWEAPNTNVVGSAYVNTTVVGVMVASYWCPSDAQPTVVNDTNTANSNAYWRVNAMRSNYLAPRAFTMITVVLAPLVRCPTSFIVVRSTTTFRRPPPKFVTG
jgi:hypothetical protein